MSKRDEKIIKILHSDKAPKKYQGKEVVVLGGKIYTFPKDDKKAGKLLNNLIKKFPGVTPTITFIPKPGTIYIMTTFK